MLSPATPATLRILVVEHAEDLVTLFEGVLQEHFGCQTVTASNFVEAVCCLEAERFDFVLSDLVLPGGGSGLELGRWLREHQPTLAKHFIIVTASAGSQELAEAVRRGEMQVLYKPFNATQLIQAVERVGQTATLWM